MLAERAKSEILAEILDEIDRQGDETRPRYVVVASCGGRLTTYSAWSEEGAQWSEHQTEEEARQMVRDMRDLRLDAEIFEVPPNAI